MPQRVWRGSGSSWAEYEDSVAAKFKAYLNQHQDLVLLNDYIVKPTSRWFWRQNLWVQTLAGFTIWVGLPSGAVFLFLRS
jgi:hypothetical protein